MSLYSVSGQPPTAFQLFYNGCSAVHACDLDLQADCEA
jgi:hypothetical protein